MVLTTFFLNEGNIAKICLQMVNAVSYMKSFPHVHVYCNAIDIWVFVEKKIPLEISIRLYLKYLR